MAIRRISELPNLSTYYPTAKLSACQFETSFNPPSDSGDKVYQSFRITGDELATMISGDINLDDRYVTINENQTINGKKNFSNGLTIKTIAIDSISQTSSDFNSSVNGIIPNTKSIAEYISACGFLKISDFDSDNIINTLQLLNGIINQNTIVLFVHPIKGKDTNIYDSLKYKIKLFENKVNYYDIDGKKNIATMKTIVDPINEKNIVFIPTLADAINFANRFKFLEGSNCYIMICDDYAYPLDIKYRKNDDNTYTILDAFPRRITFYHPDLTSGQRFIVSGSTVPIIDDNSNLVFRDMFRKIIIQTNAVVTKYINIISLRCNTEFYHLIFEQIGHPNSPYTIVNMNGLACQIQRCAFLHGHQVFLGSNTQISQCSFENCHDPIMVYGGPRCTLGGSNEFINVTHPITISQGGQLVRHGDTQGYIYCALNGNASNRSVFVVNSNGTLDYSIYAYNSLTANGVYLSSTDDGWKPLSTDEFRTEFFTNSAKLLYNVDDFYLSVCQKIEMNNLIVRDINNYPDNGCANLGEIEILSVISYGIDDDNHFMQNEEGINQLKTYEEKLLRNNQIPESWGQSTTYGYLNSGYAGFGYGDPPQVWYTQYAVNSKIEFENYIYNRHAIDNIFKEYVNEQIVPRNNGVIPMVLRVVLSPSYCVQPYQILTGDVTGANEDTRHAAVLTIKNIPILSSDTPLDNTEWNNISSIYKDTYHSYIHT